MALLKSQEKPKKKRKIKQNKQTNKATKTTTKKEQKKRETRKYKKAVYITSIAVVDFFGRIRDSAVIKI